MREEILKAFENEEFAKKVMHMKTKEEVVTALTNTGVTPTNEEIDELGGLIRGIINKLETLPESELELIAGGGKHDDLDAKASGSGWTWGGFGSGALQLIGMGKDAFISSNQTKVAQAEAHAKVGTARENASMVRDVSIVAVVVAAAGGLYAFRNEIKGFWYSDKGKK